MAAKFSQDLEDHVTCPICLGQYQDPRILPCLHTYCKGCLEELLNKTLRRCSIKCPECREVTEVEDVSSLRPNIWINRGLSLFELFNAEKNQDGEPQLMCNNCANNEPAKSKCFDCEKYMCDSCVDAHNRMTVFTKDHRLMTLEEITDKGNPVSDKPRLCGKHKGENLKLFCEDCKVLICRDCIVIDHKDHGFSFIAEVVEKYKDKLKSEINSVNKTEKQIESALNTVKNMQERVRKNSDDIEQEIDTVIDAKIRVLEEKRTALKQESRNMTALKMKRLSEQEDGLLMHSAAVKSAVNFTENLLENGNSSDILSMMEQLTNRMSELSKKDIDNEVDKEDQVKLQIRDEEPIMSPDFLRLEDEGAPDLNQCQLRPSNWKGNLAVAVRNSCGRLILIKERRIEINCCGDVVVEKTLRDGVPHFSWFASGYDYNYEILCRPKSFTYEFGLRNKIDVLIDGQRINGSPIDILF